MTNLYTKTFILNKFLFFSELSNSIYISSPNIKNFSSSACCLIFKKGVKSYDSEFLLEGFDPNDLNSCSNSINNFLDILDDGKIYTVLCVMNSINDDGRVVSKTITSESLKLDKTSNANVLSSILLQDIQNALFKYGVSDEFTLALRYREWVDEFTYKDKFVDIKKAVNDVLLDKMRKIDFNEFQSIDKRLNTLKFNSGYDLPRLDYGKFVNKELLDNFDFNIINDYNLSVIDPFDTPNEFSIFEDNRGITYHTIDIDNNKTFVQTYYPNQLGSKIKGNSWVDVTLDDKTLPENWFKRYFKDYSILYDVNGNEIAREGKYSVNFLRQTEQENQYNNKFITYDFETYTDNENNSFVYCAAFYDGTELKTYYLSDYASSSDLVLAMINDLLIKKYHGYVAYAHNGSNFDSIFLIDVLLKNSDNFNVNMVDKGLGEFISVKVSSKYSGKNARNVHISFYDSKLLISGSLSDILRDFNCKTQKTYYPYIFVNNSNLDYIGNKPDIKYFNINETEYNLIPNDNWNLREETIKYISNDVIGLHEALSKYSKEIFDNFCINIINHKTFSSLSWDIFLSNFFDSNTYQVPILKDTIDKDIRKAYYGGITEVYKPILINGAKLDKNSHYAESMLEDMPTGSPVFSNDKNIDNYFGFVYCKIKAPNESLLKNPILPVYMNGIGTIYPRGEWFAWYFSEEVKNARENYFYRVEAICGYKFERSSDLFKNYIDFFYNLKEKATLEENMIQRNIAKNSLVSIFGKAGQKKIEYKVKALSNEDFLKLDKERDIHYSYNFGEKVLVRYGEYLQPKILKALSIKSRYSIDSGESYSFSYSSSVAISAAVTAYGRMKMIPFINNPENPCVSIATDCVHLQYPLNAELINNKLGGFKLEAKINIGLYPSTNTYYINGINEKGNNVEICKSRGLGKDNIGNYILNIYDYISLIMGLPVTKFKTEFSKDLNKGTVKIFNQKKTLSGKLNNRIKLFLENGTWYDTKPLTIGIDENNKNIIIENKSDKLTQYHLIKYQEDSKNFLIKYVENSKNSLIKYEEDTKNSLIKYQKDSKNSLINIVENNNNSKIARLNELRKEMDSILNYLEYIAFDKNKDARRAEIIIEIRQLEKETGNYIRQVRADSEWDSNWGWDAEQNTTLLDIEEKPTKDE